MQAQDFRPFAYLTVPNGELYRQVVATFVAAKRRFAVHLRPEDVHEALATVAGGGAAELPAVTEALARLESWGNLRSDPDTSRVTGRAACRPVGPLGRLPDAGAVVRRGA